MSRHNHRVARVVDTRLEANSENEVTYVCEEGAQVTAYVPLASSSHTTQNTVWNLNNIADRTCRDSRLAVGMQVTLTLNITNSTGGTLSAITADNFGLKQYPVNKSVSSVQHQINQASYTLQTSRLLDSIARLNSFPQHQDFYENTQPDLIDNYANATGSNLTPLASYTSNIQGDGIFKPRTLNYTVSGTNAITAGSTSVITVVANLYEPLVTPFTNISDKNRRGLYAITGETITVQWVTDLQNKMFAFVPQTGLVVNSATVAFAESATLYCIYLTPYQDYFKEIPRESVYPYNDYQIFTTSMQNVPAGSVVSGITTAVCNFTNIPQKILIFAKLKDTLVTYQTPDKYLSITSASVQFDNGNPQLSAIAPFSGTTPPRQLYDISKRNGLVMPGACWQQLQLNVNNVAGGKTPSPVYGCGSVLVLDPVLDLGVRPDASNSSAGRYIMQATLNFANNTSTNFGSASGDVVLYVVSINSAILERVGSEYRNYLLTLPQDVLKEAKNASAIDHQLYVDSKFGNAFLSGGGIGDWFKKAFSGVKNAVKWGLKHKDDIADAYKIGEKAVKLGRKLSGKGTLLYNKNMHPMHDDSMELFYE